MNTRKEILEKAIDAVDRRPKSYGPPEQNFERIARRWAVHYKNRYALDIPCDTVDVAAMMADMKLARLEETPDHEDSWVDLAGYAACGADVARHIGTEIDRRDLAETADMWRGHVAAASKPQGLMGGLRGATMLKVGDRVRLVKRPWDARDALRVGMTGRILDIKPALEQPFLVEFDQNIGGHAGAGPLGVRGRYGHCWWAAFDCLEKVEEDLTWKRLTTPELKRMLERDIKSLRATPKPFKVGDRVKLVVKLSVMDLISDGLSDGPSLGGRGRIISKLGGPVAPYLVEFDESFPEGHSGNGRGKEGHCLWCEPFWLDKVEAEEPAPKPLQVGDRVRLTGLPPGQKARPRVGMVGRLIAIDHSRPMTHAVEFDDYIWGTSAGGQGKLGHCWWCEYCWLEKVEEEEPAWKRAKIGDMVELKSGYVVPVVKVLKGATDSHVCVDLVGEHRWVFDTSIVGVIK